MGKFFKCKQTVKFLIWNKFNTNLQNTAANANLCTMNAKCVIK